jgi:hypothetical protein
MCQWQNIIAAVKLSSYENGNGRKREIRFNIKTRCDNILKKSKVWQKLIQADTRFISKSLFDYNG